MGSDDEGKEDKGPDARMEWIRERALYAFRGKADKWDKFSLVDLNMSAIYDFLDSAAVGKLFIWADSKGDLSAKVGTLDTLAKSRVKKVLYFLKNTFKPVEDDFTTLITYGELHGESMLDFLNTITDGVFVPLLTNAENQTGWPEVIRKEVAENLHKFTAHLQITVGHSKGQTTLPLPPQESSEAAEIAKSKDDIHVIENAVVTWTRLIKNVLRTEPEGELKSGAHPGPVVELAFWASKAKNLNSIHEQLCGPSIQKVILALELSKSQYHNAFTRVCAEVAAAREEANDNLKFLKPMKRQFEKLEICDEFPELLGLFRPLLHQTLLVWKHSKFYNVPSRLVVLFREVCNDLINNASKFVDGMEVLKMEPKDAVRRLKETLQVINAFKATYFEYKDLASDEAMGTPENPWRFQNSALFARLDAFLERCHDVLDLAETIGAFMQLERVEIGGTKGKTLTMSVRQIYTDFMQAVEALQAVEYDLMDIEEKKFDDDFYSFRSLIKELERRLSSVIIQAFDDCPTVGVIFKLLDAFDTLLDREIIQLELEKKQNDLLREYSKDLRLATDAFVSGKGRPPVGKNKAPHSGAVAWARSILERIIEPMEKLRSLNEVLMQTDEAKEIEASYIALTEKVNEFEKEAVAMWVSEIEETSTEKLKLPLLRFDEKSAETMHKRGGGATEEYIEVNFDPGLIRLLREVKYFKQLNIEIPEMAEEIFKQGETFRKQTGNLELVKNTYNKILMTIIEVERPLIEQKLTNIISDGSKNLRDGLENKNWKSTGIDEYITGLMTQVKDLDQVLQSSKDNVHKIESAFGNLERNLLFERKDGKTYTMAEFSSVMKTLQAQRQQEYKDVARDVVKYVTASSKTFKTSKGAPAWKAYVEYINNILVDGFSRSILATLSYLKLQIDPVALAEQEQNPLLEIRLELLQGDPQFSPDIGLGAGEEMGVRDMVNDWISQFLKYNTVMSRLDIGEGSYLLEVEENYEIGGAITEVIELVEANEAEINGFKESYDSMSHLWKLDLKQTLAEWIAKEGEDGEDPSLDKFDDMITKYKAMQDDVQQLPTSKVIGWIKVDSKPIKQALGTWVSKWVHLFTHHLSEKVTNEMDELYAFMERSRVGLEQPTEEELAAQAEAEAEAEAEAAEEGEEGAEAKPKRDEGAELRKVRACMRDIRMRTERTDAMFKPLNETVKMLKRYGISVPETVQKKLDEAPMQWNQLKKQMLIVREQVSKRQQAEAAKIKLATESFDVKVEEFRKTFLARCPFRVKGAKVTQEDTKEAYTVLQAYYNTKPNEEYPVGSVPMLLAEAKALNENQELFELNVTSYKALSNPGMNITGCMDELVLLKNLWDQISYVQYTFATWYNTTWDNIDGEVLIENTKKMQKEAKQLKGVRNYEAYNKLEEMMKDMLTSLPLVQDLAHPAMRERHWKQLMRATGKSFVKDANFNLGNLMALQLHQFVDEVSEIVDRAQKESIIEKALKKIEETWVGLNLEFTIYGDTDIFQVVVDDLIVETLENDNMALQNMGSGKYVQGNPQFLEIVNNWQRKLGTVDSVLTTWLDLQKKWQALESIFGSSADIRVSLPESTKVFDGVNVQFQALMKDEAPDTPNVVEACNIAERQEILENMLQLLETCEKALSDYLEKKRIAFPRFYFVAPADLLDILAKGSNPQEIMRHMPKNFDNIANLEFIKAEDGSPTKNAIGMYSGEGEYVAFDQEFQCEGPVEVWLQGIVDSMRKALLEQFKVMLPMYWDQKREDWLYHPCAMLTVACSRVVYTSEMYEAFEQLEEGNDLALKDFYKKQVDQLAGLNELINSDLKKLDRKKIVHLCTIDVHARDVVQRLMDDKVENAQCFQWQSQLRYRQHEVTKDIMINICDAEIQFQYEYVGNCGCLIITPLTDRCYITLTQAQRLVLGGAPAGPAGTGKTETTKDLARALGVQCYVFNCSDQMDYRAMGQIYKGLAQCGAWGCFDEFNRIPVAVLSVCSTQYKTVLDAIRARKKTFMFEEDEISLRPTVMAFITMNPGYPGRAELPESLKALFRPVSMCVPDLSLICEIFLMSEGFLLAKILSRKFVILYSLCQDLLSKSAHYDWKLRAIKTTLNVAGTMKRADPTLTEDKVLLRALRDFNLGKLTSDDLGIFMGLLNDLFPKTLDLVPRARDYEFEEEIKKASIELGYQPEDVFSLKITQLREIFVVRWSVFLLGPAGCGKTAVWRTLLRAQQNFGEKSVYKPINPKSVTRNELYGNLHETTREWREGLMSVTFRDMSNDKSKVHQWIVLDGDIDAEWIESMNTVMDDNKMLTLASNERIPLTGSMRLLLEINHMNHCSPATVSRGGVIYINTEDVGWAPVVESWLQTREAREYIPILSEFFDRYTDETLDYVRRNFRTCTPVVGVALAQMVCKILESIIPEESSRGSAAPDKKIVEAQFVFAMVWAIGGNMFVDAVSDYRAQFDSWWQEKWKNVKYPDAGTVFDYYVSEDGTMCPWDDKVEGYTYINDLPNFGNLFVPSVETTRLGYFMDNMIAKKHYVMFVGNAGTGKTALMKARIGELDRESNMGTVVNMHSFLDAPALQVIMEQSLEKKSGVRYGPPGSKKLIYFFDDLNMPYVDKYDTQSPIELARQFVDYRGWYDKVKIVLKEVLNTMYLASMNPTAGSFTITPRFQRHFCTFAVNMPSAAIISSIYTSILTGHLSDFEPEVAKLAPTIVKATMELHKHMATNFLPTSVKFHYQFNLRDLSNIMNGMCRTIKEYYTDPMKIVRLWVHECERVFGDRLIEVAEGFQSKFKEPRELITRKNFPDFAPEEVEAVPNVYTSFLNFTPDDEAVYLDVDTFDRLKKELDGKLREYNESNAAMDLVLFEQAMEHVTRISRIISLARGNAMLVGVGGSGKQSLAKLASFINGYDVFQVQITGSYGIVEFKADLLALYVKAGAKGQPVSFLMTDNQIVKEQFCVYLNDLLSSGLIPDLFTPEDKDDMSNSVRSEVKAAGIIDTAENCWDFFIDKVRRNLHVILCFSPVGDKFRIRARQFPALVNNTVFDWFHPWPQEALRSVAVRFLSEIPDVEDDTRENLADYCALVQTKVAEYSERFATEMRRYAHTTPKSYLEFIDLYKKMLGDKRTELDNSRKRLQDGVAKIKDAQAQVAELQINLKQEQIIVEEKKANTDALIVQIGQESQVVNAEKDLSRGDEEACAAIATEVAEFQKVCEAEMAAAEPIIQEAIAALDTLDKKSLGELKSFGSPAAEVVQVASACIVLVEGLKTGKVPKDLSWNAGKKMMNNVDSFLTGLINFDKDNTPEPCVAYVEKEYLSNPNFNPEYIKSKSGAAAGLCAWVGAICKYFRIYQVVEPKRIMLAEANQKLSDANNKLVGIRAKVAALEARVEELQDGLAAATAEKNLAVRQAEKTQAKANLADRLINGLKGENKRWGETIEKFGVMEIKLIGDVLVSSAFVSYCGPFNMQYRVDLVEHEWVPELFAKEIPTSEGIKPLNVLASDSMKAKWTSEGLPSDPLSIENGAIMSNATRWPLMIDPQLQGIKWIITKEEANGLVMIQLSKRNYIDDVTKCISNGLPLMIENIPDDIDPVLDPVVARQIIRRGRNFALKMGDEEIEYDPRFKLYLQTKLSNPHYKPEIAAQTTLVNFCVTPKGLEDQLLSAVVVKERPDLQEQAENLVAQLGQFTITLAELEDNLLAELAAATGDILENVQLVENLEATKATATEIAVKVEQAQETEKVIAQAREVYRPVATRGSLFYFLIDNLNVLDRVYQYSMANYLYILKKGIDITPASPDLQKRVDSLVDNTSYVCFQYIAAGLFERHKLIVATQFCMEIMRGRGLLQPALYDYLLRGPKMGGTDNPLSEWLPDAAWQAVQALRNIEEYASLPDDIYGSAKRWREWVELERPEDEPLPGDWKKSLNEFQRLLVFRALRPDRLTNAMISFVSNTIGKKYTQSVSFDLDKAYEDAKPGTPLFIFLSPGVDVAAAVEAMGQKYGNTADTGRYAAVSLGQGQEKIAMSKIDHAHANGGWVLLQNIHLTIDWTNGPLEKRVDKLIEGAHEDFRLFLSAEPPPALEKGIAISLLQNSIKLTNEPPEGMKANLRRAWNNFTEEMLEACAKQAEFKSIVFALCYFHAALLERKKYGVGNLPNATNGIGWNMNYPFNTGDLLCCGQCANNYLENNNKVPWQDLIYIFGEIMYGGHIVEDWDRRLAESYLKSYFTEALLEGIEFVPKFSSPTPNLNHKQVDQYIEDTFPAETPLAYGFHPNAEIGFRLREAESLCSNLLLMQPRDSAGAGGQTMDDKAKQVLDSVVEKCPDLFDMEDIRGRVEEVTPYIMVAIQEAERMNLLLGEIKRSLAELDLGLSGALTMSPPMEACMMALANGRVPDSWVKKAYPSLRSLDQWVDNVLERCVQLNGWTAELAVPKVTMLSYLFNPQSFLTAVMQTTARRNDWPLDKTVVLTDVTKKQVEEVDAAARDGAFISGLTLEGARWDDKVGVLEDSRPKELSCYMPVILIKAVTVDKAEVKDAYKCPVYTTQRRFREEVFTAQLKSKGGEIKWTLAGVAMFLEFIAS